MVTVIGIVCLEGLRAHVNYLNPSKIYCGYCGRVTLQFNLINYFTFLKKSQGKQIQMDGHSTLEP